MSAPPTGILGYAYRRAGATYFSEADPRPIRGEDVAPVEWCTPVVAAPEGSGAPADWTALQAAGRWVGAKPAASGEPVAWWIPKAEQFALAKKDGSRPFAKAWEPLYATQHPAPARVPLTLRQISDATHGYGHVRSDYVIAIARAIEAAHGITAPDERPNA